MTESEKVQVIRKTLEHEGGFGIDNNGYWVYQGINAKYNSDWDGWDIVAKNLNRTKFEQFKPQKNELYKLWKDDPVLDRKVIERASQVYFNGNSFENYNDMRVVSNLFDQKYAGGMESVMQCAFGTSNKAQAASIANSMGDEALPKVIECRMKYTQSIKFGQQTENGDPEGCSTTKGCTCKTRINSDGKQYTERGANYYRKAHYDRIAKHNADWMAGGTSPYFPDTNNYSEEAYRNITDVKRLNSPRDGNWFLEHLGKNS
jgi:hypothetical protein